MLSMLYAVAKENDILVVDLKLDKAEAMSIMDDSQNCCIGIDSSRITSQGDGVVKFAHEMGHCMTGAFYNRYSKLNIIGKYERKADKWAIQKILPQEKLEEAVAYGNTELWQLAEYFDLPQDFVEKAVRYYKNIY